MEWPIPGRERVTEQHFMRDAQFKSHRLTSSLNNKRRGLTTSSSFMVSQTTYVMVTLIVADGAMNQSDSITSGNRSPAQQFNPLYFVGLLVKYFIKQPDRFSFSSGSFCLPVHHKMFWHPHHLRSAWVYHTFPSHFSNSPFRSTPLSKNAKQVIPNGEWMVLLPTVLSPRHCPMITFRLPICCLRLATVSL